MKYSLWERPDLYIENSPVFKADKVTTPLLIMHNDETIVPFVQGVEWFQSLRHLNKKVWLLKYDGEDHILDKEVNQKDYTIRLSQFFDHYLKDKSAPVWMTQNVLMSKKGIETGYELDPGVKP